MKTKTLLLAVLLLSFGLGAASNLLGTAEAMNQDKAKDKAKDSKDSKEKDGKDKAKDGNQANAAEKAAAVKRIQDALNSLHQSQTTIKASIKAEADRKHLSEHVIKELLKALDEAGDSISHAKKALAAEVTGK